jgi:hypothetical protein
MQAGILSATHTLPAYAKESIQIALEGNDVDYGTTPFVTGFEVLALQVICYALIAG